MVMQTFLYNDVYLATCLSIRRTRSVHHIGFIATGPALNLHHLCNARISMVTSLVFRGMTSFIALVTKINSRVKSVSPGNFEVIPLKANLETLETCR